MKRTTTTRMLLAAALLMLGLATVMNTAVATVSPALTVTAIADREYTGAAITPSVEIKDGSYTLIAGTDYILAYSNNTSAGTATVHVGGWRTYFGINFDVPFQITPKAVGLTWNNTATRPYDRNASAVTATATGLVSGDTCTVTVSGGTESAANTHTATATALSNTNYKLPATKTQTYTITAKTVGLTWNNTATRPYDGNASAVTATATGLVSGDTCTVTVSGGTESAANTHTATATALSNTNYKLPATKIQTYTITAKEVGLTWSNTATRPYDGNASAVTATATGLVSPDVCTVTVTGGEGIIATTHTATATALSNPNYVLPASGTTQDYIITAAALPAIATLPSVVYTGSAFTPDVGAGSLVKDRDYTLVYSNNTNVGTATVTVTGKGNYTGIAVKNFEITPAPLPAVTAPGSVVYTGSAFTPEVVVGSLVKGTDYTLAYAHNINKGTATVTVTGKGNYAGTETVTFDITAAPLPFVASPADAVYTGSAFTPDVGADSLVKDRDYALAYSNNTNVGTATVTVTGKGNYTGTAVKNFEITPAPLPAVTAPGSVVYTGSAFTPDVGAGSLVKDRDYTLAYSNNTNVGTATVTVTGKGNYTGTVISTFEITPAMLPAVTAPGSVVYTGSAFTPDVVMTNIHIGSLVKDRDYTLSYVNNINKGTATVTVVGMGNYTGTAAVTFNIAASPLPFVASPADAVYTGNAFTPDVVMTNVHTGNLIKDRDYTLAYAHNINKGTATVTVTGKGNYTSTVISTFEITPATLPAVTAPGSVVYTGSAFTPDVVMTNIHTGNLVKDRDYTLSYVNNINKGTATVTVVGMGNYTGTVNRAFEINAAPLPVVTAPADVVYTGSVFTPDVVMTNVITGSLVKDRDYTLAYANNTNAGTATVSVTGKGNYTGTVISTFEITPATLPAVTAPGNAVYTGRAFTPDAGAGSLVKDRDYTLAYAHNINMGTATVTVTGKGNYTGTETLTFEISAAPLPSVASPADAVYTGSAFTPDVVMTNVHTGNLVKDRDYTLSYANNVNKGTATVTVVGIGNYTGTVNRAFEITAAQLPAVTAPGKVVYTGRAFTPDVVMTNVHTGNLVKDRDYTLSYANNINKGTATITVTGIGNYTGIQTARFAILAASLPVPPPKADQTNTGEPGFRSDDSDSDGISDRVEAMLMSLHQPSDFNSSAAMEILLNTNRGGMMPALDGVGRARSLNQLAGSNFLETLFYNYQAQPDSAGVRFIPADGEGDTLTLNIAGGEAMAFKLNARDNRFFSMFRGTLLEHTRDANGNLVMGGALNLNLLRDKDGKPVFDYPEESDKNLDTPVVMSDKAGTLFLIGSWSRLHDRVTQDLLLIDIAAQNAYRLPGSAGASRFDVAPSGSRLAYILGGKPIIIDLGTVQRYTPASRASLLGFTDGGDLIISLRGSRATIVDNDGKESLIDFEGLLNVIQPTNNHRNLVYIKGGMVTPFSFTASAGIDISQGEIIQRAQVVMDGFDASVPAYNSVRLFSAEASQGLNIKISIFRDYAR